MDYIADDEEDSGVDDDDDLVTVVEDDYVSDTGKYVGRVDLAVDTEDIVLCNDLLTEEMSKVCTDDVVD